MSRISDADLPGTALPATFLSTTSPPPFILHLGIITGVLLAVVVAQSVFIILRILQKKDSRNCQSLAEPVQTVFKNKDLCDFVQPIQTIVRNNFGPDVPENEDLVNRVEDVSEVEPEDLVDLVEDDVEDVLEEYDNRDEEIRQVSKEDIDNHVLAVLEKEDLGDHHVRQNSKENLDNHVQAVLEKEYLRDDHVRQVSKEDLDNPVPAVLENEDLHVHVGDDHIRQVSKEDLYNHRAAVLEKEELRDDDVRQVSKEDLDNCVPAILEKEDLRDDHIRQVSKEDLDNPVQAVVEKEDLGDDHVRQVSKEDLDNPVQAVVEKEDQGDDHVRQLSKEDLDNHVQAVLEKEDLRDDRLRAVSTENRQNPVQGVLQKENVRDNHERAVSKNGFEFLVQAFENEDQRDDQIPVVSKEDFKYFVRAAVEMDILRDDRVHSVLKKNLKCSVQRVLDKKKLRDDDVRAVSKKDFEYREQVVSKKEDLRCVGRAVLENEQSGSPVLRIFEYEDLEFDLVQVISKTKEPERSVHAASKSEDRVELVQVALEQKDLLLYFKNEGLECNPIQTVLKNDHLIDLVPGVVLENEDRGVSVEAVIGIDDLGDLSVQRVLKNENQAVQKMHKKYRKKNAWGSRYSFARKSKTTIPSVNSLFKAFTVFAILKGVSSNIIESPENQVVLANTIATMKCRTDSTTKPVRWTGFDRASKAVSIFDGERVNPSYEGFCSVTPNEGRYDLQVKATSQMALKYTCIESGADAAERSSELIVIESDPTCTEYNTTNPDYILIACTMSFSGNSIPTMTWRANGTQEPLTATNHMERLNGQQVLVTSILHNVSRNDTHKYVYDTLFVLEMRYECVGGGNVPSYNYTGLLLPVLPRTAMAPTLPPMTLTSPIPPSCWIYALISAVVTGTSVAAFTFIVFKIYKRIKENRFGRCCHKAKSITLTTLDMTVKEELVSQNNGVSE